ncbi:MAG: glycine betaine ABC transporter substrate-binding protein [[Clostridium] scindens]
MQWDGMYGFNNTYRLAVRREGPEQYDLKTYSDLKDVASQLVFGAKYDFFEREDGYDALCKAYGLEFKSTMDMDIGLKYQALNQGRSCHGHIYYGWAVGERVGCRRAGRRPAFLSFYLCGNVVRSEVKSIRLKMC